MPSHMTGGPRSGAGMSHTRTTLSRGLPGMGMPQGCGHLKRKMSRYFLRLQVRCARRTGDGLPPLPVLQPEAQGMGPRGGGLGSGHHAIGTDIYLYI